MREPPVMDISETSKNQPFFMKERAIRKASLFQIFSKYSEDQSKGSIITKTSLFSFLIPLG
jgi:hypothetical protein